MNRETYHCTRELLAAHFLIILSIYFYTYLGYKTRLFSYKFNFSTSKCRVPTFFHTVNGIAQANTF